MRYLSVCSGIEAVTVAWRPLGFEPVAFAEIDRFPSAVLKHHYPDVPNWGDLTKFREWPNATIDVLVGGTPCQSFSVAGLRAGLADPRGNLALTYLACVDRYRPEWVVWENVPGVLSATSHTAPDPCPPPPPVDLGCDGFEMETEDEYRAEELHAFYCFLAGLSELGYGWAYRVLDAQYFHLAQRRARVFVVGHRGDWRRAAAVLFERESLSGHPAPRREAGQGITCSPEGIAGSCSSKWSKGTGGPSGDEHYNLIAGTLTASGAGSARPAGRKNEIDSIVTVDGGHCVHGVRWSHECRECGIWRCYPKREPSQAVAFSENLRGEVLETDYTRALQGAGGKPGQGYQAARIGMQVRRLTPRECERLQGFPDDYTLIPYRGKPAADGPRYKALGNSMAVPVMRWIGRRIKLVSELPK